MAEDGWEEPEGRDDWAERSDEPEVREELEGLYGAYLLVA